MNFKKIYPVVFILLCCLIPYFCAGTSTQSVPAMQSDKNEFIVKLYRSKTKKVEEIGLEEYLCGVVAAEMQANYESEALKAQAVAACTYTLYRYEYIKDNENADNGHKGAYVCDDCTHCKGYLSADDARKRWGKEWYDSYYDNIVFAVKQVCGQVITYNGKVINAVFHAISSGTTESAENVWGSEIPYLKSVDSATDTTAAGYETSVTYSEKEVKEILKKLSVDVGDDPGKWFGSPELDSAGSVDSVKIGDKNIDGTTLREAFSLRSTAFAITYRESEFVFTVHGYGHQVGMSQYGANQLALNGKNYTEILQHYYSDVKIQNYNF